MSKRTRVGRFLFAFLLTAGAPYAFAQQPPDGLNDQQRLGRQVLAQSCGVCHLPPARGARTYGPVLSKTSGGGNDDLVRKVILEKIKGDQLTYSNIVALGEFLLGYSNEYNEYTDRPLIDSSSKGAAELLPALDQPQKKDLGRNGTYLVVRQLVQDVRKFWQFADSAARSNSDERKRLAEAMLGRAINGTPLVPLQDRPIDGVGADEKDRAYNQFTYESDPSGDRCPLGSHVRRANPRNADFPNPITETIAHLIQTLGFGRKHLRDDLMSPTRFHRLLRRGREYGPGLSPDDALRPRPDNDEERGLHFICINSNIARQFEFVQGAWLMSTKFNGLSEESDPMMGDRAAVAGCPLPDKFSIPRQSGLRERRNDLPQFVTVRGGAYFFLPSLRALRYFASVGGDGFLDKIKSKLTNFQAQS